MRLDLKEVLLIVALLLIAIVRFLFFVPEPPDYIKAVGKDVSLNGFVVESPDVRLTNQRIVIKPENQESNILVIIPNYVDVSYGDIVKVKGTLETPENFITNSGKEFNYKRYLANKDIYFVVNNASLEIISRNNGSKLKSWLFNFRLMFMKNINKVILPPESDLSLGLILGARGGFDKEKQNELISTGTIHIVALSGYNVTIVAEGVMKVLGILFSQTLSMVFGIFFVFLFVIMAGASATAIRAGIMATIALLGRMTGRKYDAGRALIIAGLIMFAYNPRVISDISFQLSFIATGGVLFVTPKVISWVKFLPMRFNFRELVATTIAATLSVLPLLLYATGIFSLVSLPANVLILSFIPLTMLFSFLTGALGFISPLLSLPFAFISHLLLSYILGVIHFFASLPFASVNIKSFPLVVTLLLYIFLIWWVFKKEKNA